MARVRTKVIRISKNRDEESHLTETRGKAKAINKSEANFQLQRK